jgi:hypothetical protein
MDLSLLGWLFALGAVAHNAEEAMLFPAWSVRFGRWYASVSSERFRFAAIILSALGLLAALFASLGGAQSAGAYFISGYALAMALNAFVPHIAATVALRVYVPGAATALLFNLPLGSWLVYRSLIEGYVDPKVFAIVGPAIVLCMLASLPLLLGMGAGTRKELTMRSTRRAKTHARLRRR